MEAQTRCTQEWTDAGGVAHEPFRSRERRRIVSLVPSLTESLCALGGRDQLVGCTAFCIRPPGLLTDPRILKVGGTKKFNREKLLSLKPDLVLLNLEENELEDIAFLRAQVECYVNGVKTVADGIESLRELGAFIGAHVRAEALAREAQEVLDRVRERVRERTTAGGRTVRVFYPIWRDPWMSVGSDTFIADHLRTLGAEEVPRVAGASRYPTVTLVQAAASGPDVVWLPSEPYAFKALDAQELLTMPGLERVPVELVNGDHVCWFGVRQTEGLAYAYRTLWRQDLEHGPLPVDWPPSKR